MAETQHTPTPIGINLVNAFYELVKAAEFWLEYHIELGSQPSAGDFEELQAWSNEVRDLRVRAIKQARAALAQARGAA